ncbi:MAG: NAD(P)/FAD-dependent oxidoreductase [Actinomycetota bacterium]|nr:NAD(P)/FAD-dependent oxidoreductase [Actinomycetota bacterium]
MRLKYDVIIVGAGPAGIFCALKLSESAKLRVLVIDKGGPIEKRACPSAQGACRKCKPCSLLSGWGGAGAFSDGKLTLSKEVGGWLSEIISSRNLERLITLVDRTYVEFGAPEVLFGSDEEKIAEIAKEAIKAEILLVPSKVRHIGTENCPKILAGMFDELSGRVDILMETKVEEIRVKNQRVQGVVLSDGSSIDCSYLVVAPGRSGAEWFSNVARRLNLTLENSMVDIGVRVEVPAVILEPLTAELYEPKLVHFSKSSDDRVRTFCMNPNGEVMKEYYDDVLTVNGHSFVDKKTDNTNFALLIDKRFTEPFKEPISYGRYIARLANLLGGGILVQRLGDLIDGRRSTEKRIARSTVKPTLEEATPGDLSLVLPFRFLSGIIEMLEALDNLTPGVFSRNTLLYGVEVKFYSSRLRVTKQLESEVENLFGAGDGAGISRGLVQASVSGIVAAQSIIRRARAS